MTFIFSQYCLELNSAFNHKDRVLNLTCPTMALANEVFNCSLEFFGYRCFPAQYTLIFGDGRNVSFIQTDKSELVDNIYSVEIIKKSYCVDGNYSLVAYVHNSSRPNITISITVSESM